MNALDAAARILGEAGGPLHVNEITRRMIDRDLWQTTGQTPATTVNATISVHIKEAGEHALFRRTGRSIYTINSLPVPIEPSSSAPEPALPSSLSSISAPPITVPMALGTQTISFTDAAEQVLEDLAKQQPMHYHEITRYALEQGLITTAGQTPAATMYAVILTEIDRLVKRVEQARFVKYGRGMVGLTKWNTQDDSLIVQIDKHNREVRQKLHENLHTMKPSEFEALIGRLLIALGFDSVAVTPLGGDGGIDVRGILVVGDVIRIRMAVQVKRWKKNVQSPIVQQVRGSLGAHEQGLIITTSDFSKGARAEAARSDATPVALMNGVQLVNLLIEHRIKVRRTSYDLIDMGEDEDL